MLMICRSSASRECYDYAVDAAMHCLPFGLLLWINTYIIIQNEHGQQRKKYNHRKCVTVDYSSKFAASTTSKSQKSLCSSRSSRSSDSFSRVHILLDECVGCVGSELGGEIPVILWVNPRLNAGEQKDAERLGRNHGGYAL